MLTLTRVYRRGPLWFCSCPQYREDLPFTAGSTKPPVAISHCPMGTILFLTLCSVFRRLLFHGPYLIPSSLLGHDRPGYRSSQFWMLNRLSDMSLFLGCWIPVPGVFVTASICAFCMCSLLSARARAPHRSRWPRWRPPPCCRGACGSGGGCLEDRHWASQGRSPGLSCLLCPQELLTCPAGSATCPRL